MPLSSRSSPHTPGQQFMYEPWFGGPCSARILCWMPMLFNSPKLTMSPRSPFSGRAGLQETHSLTVSRSPRAGTHLRAWRPRWASVQWWAWLDSSSPRPGRPLRKRRHLGGGGGSHSLAQSFIPRNGATGQSAQGRLPESQNGAKCSAHTADRGDGCHRREQNSPGCKGPSPPVHHPADPQHGRSGSAN